MVVVGGRDGTFPLRRPLQLPLSHHLFSAFWDYPLRLFNYTSEGGEKGELIQTTLLGG